MSEVTSLVRVLFRVITALCVSRHFLNLWLIRERVCLTTQFQASRLLLCTLSEEGPGVFPSFRPSAFPVLCSLASQGLSLPGVWATASLAVMAISWVPIPLA